LAAPLEPTRSRTHPPECTGYDAGIRLARPQAEIQGLKERVGWELIPWYTITDDFDKDFGVDEWHGHNAEDSPEGYPQTPPYQWWNYHDAYSRDG
jgi:predicted dithiol-disulfide oxidoreductase (DUF899 family)